MTSHKILIDLDTLFDTRLGVVTEHDPELSVELLKKGWRERVSNDMSIFTDKFSYDIFKERYEKRDKEILKKSLLTSFIIELGDIIVELQHLLATDTGKIKESEILLNLYPYTDLDKEEANAYIIGLASYIGTEIPIRIVYWEPEVLTLPFLRSQEVLTYITYDYEKWLGSIFSIEQGKSVIIPYPELQVLTIESLPDKNTMDNFSAEEKKLIGTGGIFDFMRLYWAPFFGLVFYPINVMSIVDGNITNPYPSDSSPDTAS